MTSKSLPLVVALIIVLSSVTFAHGAFQPAALAQTEPRMSGLHVVGNQIRNGDGVRVRLVGVNRASSEYMCLHDWGGVFDGPANQSEVIAMQSWNIKAVRVALNEDCWLAINGVSTAYSGIQYQNAVAAYVNLLTSQNIAVIVNLHWSAPGTQLATGQQPMPDRDHSPAFWQSVAARFKDNSAVLFEPFNEPYPDGGNNTLAAWSCWRDGGICSGVPFIASGMQELVTAIRGTGATNIIILPGNNWGSQINQWLLFEPNDPLNQLAVGWHSYGDGLDCQNETCWNSLLATLLQLVPIIATEMGEFDCQHTYIDRVMNFLDVYGQSYLAWSWGPYGCAVDPALLTDWSGTPTQTYGQGFKDHLISLGGASTQTQTPTAMPTSTATATSTGAPTSTPTLTSTPSTLGWPSASGCS